MRKICERMGRRLAGGRVLTAIAAVLLLLGSGTAAIAAGGQNGDLGHYQAVVTSALAPPPWNGPTEPAAAPKDKYLVGVSCTWALAGCRVLAQGAEHAAKRIGWRAKTIVVSDPTRYDEALETAINSGANAVVLTGVDQKLIPGGLALARKKNVPVISLYQYNEGGKYGVAVDVHPDGNLIGKLLADSAIVNNKGKVRALFLEDAEFSLPVTVLAAIRKELDACKVCDISYADPIKFTASTVNTTLPNRVVAAVRRDPKINSIFIGYDPPVALIVPALDAAGFRNRVTMYSQLGNAGPLALVRDGNIFVTDATSSEEWGGWGSVDEAIRLLDGKPVVDERIPVRLMTSTAPQDLPPPGQVWVGTESGFREHYLKLWGVQ